MLFFITIFIGAFLLFQVQPFIAKIILPYFGGGAAVWTACMLFFQAFLLFGYLYAHLLSKCSTFKKQAVVHGALLLFSLVFLPINVDNELTVLSTEQPLWSIIYLLTVTVGLPYLLLSATGPLVQHWFSLSVVGKQAYRLYSWSNLASLLALLSFPFLFEPLLSSTNQAMFWSVGYGIYCVVIMVLMIITAKQLALPVFNKRDLPEADLNKTANESFAQANPANAQDNLTQDGESYHKYQPLLWLALSTLGVVLLVSTTNAMTQNIPPIPFLWILPLCLYLLSFIISFHSPKWYVRWYWLLLFIPTSLIAILMFFIGSQFDITSQVLIYSSILFSACMICHGELAKLKPNVERLTWYYLVMAFGGLLGSVLVAFVAQHVFIQFLEFPLAIIAVLALFALSVYTSEKQVNKLVFTSGGLAIFCSVILAQLNSQYVKTDIHSARNFYGILSVKDVEIDGVKERRLIDGTTSHGTQYLSAEHKNTPLSYYRKDTGVAIALEQFSLINQAQGKSLTVGLVGLGAGTLAAYGKPNDEYRFYELNPAVLDAAQNYFTYLADSQANITLVVGDGRVSLANELKAAKSNQNALAPFDVLVIDAFSGDSIPQHLLTVEAMDLYWQHLHENGVLAVHISNTHLNLLPLMQGLAQQTGKEIRYFKTKAATEYGHDTEWVWLTNHKELLENAEVVAKHTPIKSETKLVVWSDDFSHLLSLLK